MAVPKAKLLALFTVAMMVVSMTCIVYAGEDSKADSTGSISLDTASHDKSYFTGLGATCDDASYTYNSVGKTGTLKIKNFTFATSNHVAIETANDINLVIEVEGNNSISTKDIQNNSSCCINPGSNIVISGDAGSRLILVSGDSDGSSSGIETKGNITIKGGMTLDVTAGDSSGDDSSSIGLRGASVSIEDSSVSVTSGDASDESCGIKTEAKEGGSGGTISIQDSTVSVTSGDATGLSGSSGGIVAYILTVTGTNTVVKSKGGVAFNSIGAVAQSDATITGATVEFEGKALTSGVSTGLTCGNKIVADHANIKATGGTIQEGDDANGSCGISIYSAYSGNSSFTDSVITAIGGETKGTGSHSAGILLSQGSSSTTSFTRCTFLSVIGYESAFFNNGGSFAIDDYQSLEGSSTVENPSFGAVNASNLTTFKYIRSVIAEPALEITSPIDGSTVSGSTVEVTGITNCSSVKITVNGTDVGEVEVIDGSFSKTVTLSQGKNTITVTVTNIAGQSLTEEIEVTYGAASQSSDTNPAVLAVAALTILAVAGIALYPRKD